MSEEVDAFLAHHGVKGMKWGVQKSKTSKSSSSSEGDKKPKMTKEQKKKIYNRAVIGTSLAMLSPMVAAATAVGVQMGLEAAVTSKQASNGRKHAANMFADGRGLTSYKTIDLAYNGTSKRWE